MHCTMRHCAPVFFRSAVCVPARRGESFTALPMGMSKTLSCMWWLRIGHGRDLDTRKRAAQTVFDGLCSHLQPVFARSPLAISLELQEIDPVLSYQEEQSARSRQAAAGRRGGYAMNEALVCNVEKCDEYLRRFGPGPRGLTISDCRYE